MKNLIAIFATQVTEETQSYLDILLQKAQQNSKHIVFFEEYYQQLKDTSWFEGQYPTFQSHEELVSFQPQQCFTFGGDGTILKAITYIQGANIPLIGINTGRLGFLANIPKEDFENSIDALLHEKYHISKREVIQVQCSCKTQLDFNFALNELAVSRKETTSMITVDAWVNGEFLNTFWADGLIISTPTGSTGYSLSCGGPIISPDSDSFVITPIAPHNLNVRPLLIHNNCEIKLKINSRVPEYSLSLDSRIYTHAIDNELVVSKAPFSILLAESQDHSYYETIRKKLLWGHDSRN